jgi:ribosomal protein S20
MLENQMQTHIRLADMRRTYLDTAKAQIYMATRTGDKARAQEVMAMAYQYIDRQVKQGILTKQEGGIEKAKFSEQLKTVVGLAQYTATQFGKLNLTPVEREAQTKDNLEFQQKIADNTKRSLEEARKAIDEEKRQAEADQQARELRYLRDGGAVGRYNWAAIVP